MSGQDGLNFQAVLRIGYGILQAGFLYTLYANRRQFFRTEKWNGYIFDSKIENFWNRPVLADLVLLVWFVSVFNFVIGFQTVLFSFFNLVLCRYYFIHLRWKSLARGCGAPGFVAQWLAMAVFLLEFTSAIGPSPVRVAVILLLQIDFALIILSAGFYKFFGGYRHNEGMEYGMVNPMWGYRWKKYFRKKPSSSEFVFLNHLGWFTEILAAVLMLIPSTRFWGGLLLAVTFLFIAAQIRLGFLCYMVALISLIYIGPFPWPAEASPLFAALMPLAAHKALLLYFCAQIGLLPLAYAGIWYNHKTGKKLLPPFQKILEVYTNWFGVIIWRVFSKDLTELMITVTAVSADEGERFVSRYGDKPEWSGFRYSQVTESITLCCLFTTLRYYPGEKELFARKLRQYARTVIKPGEDKIIYKISRIQKISDQFAEKLCAIYTVQTESGLLTEDVREDIRVIADKKNSLLNAAQKPGSYA